MAIIFVFSGLLPWWCSIIIGAPLPSLPAAASTASSSSTLPPSRLQLMSLSLSSSYPMLMRESSVAPNPLRCLSSPFLVAPDCSRQCSLRQPPPPFSALVAGCGCCLAPSADKGVGPPLLSWSLLSAPLSCKRKRRRPEDNNERLTSTPHMH